MTSGISQKVGEGPVSISSTSGHGLPGVLCPLNSLDDESEAAQSRHLRHCLAMGNKLQSLLGIDYSTPLALSFSAVGNLLEETTKALIPT